MASQAKAATRPGASPTSRTGPAPRTGLYGPLGEIVQETRTIPIQGNQSITYQTAYQYDTWNRLLNITYPDPRHETVTYSWPDGLPRRRCSTGGIRVCGRKHGRCHSRQGSFLGQHAAWHRLPDQHLVVPPPSGHGRRCERPIGATPARLLQWAASGVFCGTWPLGQIESALLSDRHSPSWRIKRRSGVQL